jgi:hypothetical protein
MFTSFSPCLCELKLGRKETRLKLEATNLPSLESGKDFITYFLFHEGKQTCDLFTSEIGLAVNLYSEFA